MTYTRSKTKKDEQAVRQLAACLIAKKLNLFPLKIGQFFDIF